MRPRNVQKLIRGGCNSRALKSVSEVDDGTFKINLMANNDGNITHLHINNYRTNNNSVIVGVNSVREAIDLIPEDYISKLSVEEI